MAPESYHSFSLAVIVYTAVLFSLIEIPVLHLIHPCPVFPVIDSKFFADGFYAQPHSLFRASAYFPNFGIVKIVQRIEQKTLPLGGRARRKGRWKLPSKSTGGSCPLRSAPRLLTIWNRPSGTIGSSTGGYENDGFRFLKSRHFRA